METPIAEPTTRAENLSIEARALKSVADERAGHVFRLIGDGHRDTAAQVVTYAGCGLDGTHIRRPEVRFRPGLPDMRSRRHPDRGLMLGCPVPYRSVPFRTSGSARLI